MEKTLAIINQMEELGLVGKYAIAGAFAATRYLFMNISRVFFEYNARNLEIWDSLVAHHGLAAKWEAFRKRFLTPIE